MAKAKRKTKISRKRRKAVKNKSNLNQIVIRIVLAAIVFMILAQIIHTIGAMASMGYYLDPVYSGIWSSLMMGPNSAPGIDFFMTSLSFAFITGIFISLTYAIIKKSIPGNTWAKKGLNFGAIIFLVGSAPGMLSMYLLINLPVALVSFWIIEGFILNIVTGLAIAKVLDI